MKSNVAVPHCSKYVSKCRCISESLPPVLAPMRLPGPSNKLILFISVAYRVTKTIMYILSNYMISYCYLNKKQRPVEVGI